MTTTFARLGVPSRIVDALAARGITEPFEIQSATIADALAGHDVLGRAPTGSGKTLAFGIPLVASVGEARPKRPRALVLAPTRELAEQIRNELATFAGPVRLGAVYGGVGYGPQINSLRRGVDVLVACPGRLEDLIAQGDVSLDDVHHVVIDEADRMADMGFLPAVRRLLDQTADDRQTVLFSATLEGDVARLVEQYQRSPKRHEVGPATPDITTASHLFWTVDRADRVGVTADAVTAVWPAIVFTRTRHGADRVARQLTRAGVEAAPIHGGRSQGQRNRALAAFTTGRVQALVATDVAARGIHVDDVAAVVHFDPPEDHTTYVHRSGRTARAGKGGVVVSLVQPDQRKDNRRMQRQLDLDVDLTSPDAEALRVLAPHSGRTFVTPTEPVRTGGGDRDGARRGGSQGGQRGRGQGGRGQGPKSKRGGGRPAGGSKGSSSRRGPSAKPRSGSSTDGRSQGSGSKAPARGQGKGPGQGKGQGQRQGQGRKRKPATRAAGGPNSGRPNRKARRAHLQPANRRSR